MKTALLALSLLVVASSADAQRLTEARGGAATPVDSIRPVVLIEPTRDASMAWMGTVFGAAGIFAGAYAGAAAACGNTADTGDDYCELEGGLLGALAGEMLMLPLGVHYASSHSSYGRKLLASSVVMLGGMVLAPVTAGISLLAVPPVQVMAAMRVENRAIARRSGR